MKSFIVYWVIGFLLVACSATKEQKQLEEEIKEDLFSSIMSVDFLSTQSLIQNGANLNVYDFEGYTPLMRALKTGNSNLVGLLIRGGANIYIPKQKDKELTLFLMLDSRDQEMTRIINNESNRYGKNLEDLILNEDYEGALAFSKANYIPFYLQMPKSQKDALNLVATLYTHKKEGSTYSSDVSRTEIDPQNPVYALINETSNKQLDFDRIQYISYLLRQIPIRSEKYISYLIDHEDNLRSLFESVKGTPTQKVISQIYSEYGIALSIHFTKPPDQTQNLQENSEGGCSPVQHLQITSVSTKDQSSLEWLNLKLKLFNDSQQPLPMKDFHRFLYIEVIDSQLRDKPSSWRELTDKIFQSRNKNSEKTIFTQELLNLLLSRSQLDDRYLKSALDLLNKWASQKIPASSTSFDENFLMVAQAIESEFYEVDLVQSLAQTLLSFSPNVKNRAEETMRFIWNGQFSDLQKVELFRLISQQLKVKLPSNFLSRAMKGKGLKATREIVTQSGFEFNPEEQEEAILSTIIFGESPEKVYIQLKWLKERNVSFNTSFGIRTITAVLEKIWETQKDYRESLRFLLSSKPSPIQKMTDTEILKILSKYLQFVRLDKMNSLEKGGAKGLNKSNLREKSMLTLLNGLKRKFPPYHYEKSVKELPPVYELRSANVSFVWDAILTLYEVYKKNPKQLHAQRTLILEFISLFPEETFTMTFSEKEEKNLEGLLFQNMLPLSLILSLDEQEIIEALSTETKENYTVNHRLTNTEFSWKSFLGGGIYQHYSIGVDFWKEVSKALLNHYHARSFVLPKNQVSLDFVRIMVHANQLQEFPLLVDFLGQQSLVQDKNAFSCRLRKEDIDSAQLPEVKEDYIWGVKIGYGQENNDNPLLSFKGYSPLWTSLGPIEVLLPLRKKSCSGKTLNIEEIHFIQQFIKYNINEESLQIRPTLKQSRTYFDHLPEIHPETWFTKTLTSCFPEEGQGSEIYTPLSPIYSPMGLPLTLKDNSKAVGADLRGPENLFYLHKPQKSVVDSAIRSFLSFWYHCAMEQEKDTTLIDYFKAIEEAFSLKHQKKPLNREVYVCYSKPQLSCETVQGSLYH